MRQLFLKRCPLCQLFFNIYQKIEAESILYGDVNGDGNVNLLDANKLKKFLNNAIFLAFPWPTGERTKEILSGTYRTEYTFNQVPALEYEATSFEHAGPMRQDPDHIRRAINITGPKGRRQLQCAMTISGYNDTSA